MSDAPCFSRKVPYADSEAARRATIGSPLRRYRCAACGLWHLSRETKVEYRRLRRRAMA
jgi:hypothetical protein